MLEQPRIRPLRVDVGPSGLDDPFASETGFGNSVTINGEALPVSGMSVAEVRRRFADHFAIDRRYRAVLDGQGIDDETVILQPGQQLEFVRHAGEKGSGRGDD